MTIRFHHRRATYTPATTVAFPANINGVEQVCEISADALQDHFGATSNLGFDLVEAFENNRASIERMAVAVIPQVMAKRGRCLLEASDFEEA
jgi:hypothetical protein